VKLSEADNGEYIITKIPNNKQLVDLGVYPGKKITYKDHIIKVLDSTYYIDKKLMDSIEVDLV